MCIRDRAFTFQIYFDFSGYSDMAIGLGRMLGFEFLPNFNYPYISKSITEFWRRWHIDVYKRQPPSGPPAGQARALAFMFPKIYLSPGIRVVFSQKS